MISPLFVALNSVDCDIDTLTGNMKEVILLTAQKVLGRQVNPEFNDILVLCNQRWTMKRERKSKQKQTTNFYP